MLTLQFTLQGTSYNQNTESFVQANARMRYWNEFQVLTSPVKYKSGIDKSVLISLD